MSAAWLIATPPNKGTDLNILTIHGVTGIFDNLNATNVINSGETGLLTLSGNVTGTTEFDVVNVGRQVTLRLGAKLGTGGATGSISLTGLPSQYIPIFDVVQPCLVYNAGSHIYGSASISSTNGILGIFALNGSDPLGDFDAGTLNGFNDDIYLTYLTS